MTKKKNEQHFSDLRNNIKLSSNLISEVQEGEGSDQKKYLEK